MYKRKRPVLTGQFLITFLNSRCPWFVGFCETKIVSFVSLNVYKCSKSELAVHTCRLGLEDQCMYLS